MVERFLRQLSVRRRIIGSLLVFLLLTALSIPLIINNQIFLTNRLQQVTNVEGQADRLLLLGSARLSSSRVNLLRYTQDYAPSAYEAADDAQQAIELISEAQGLIENQEQKETLRVLLDALVDYELLISQIEDARQTELSQDAVQLEFQAYRLGNDISQRIELIVQESQARVTATNEEIATEARNRIILIVVGYVGLLVLTLIFGRLIDLSITRPVAQLNEVTEAFRLGNFATRIPVVGADELTQLSRTFNQMAEQLTEIYQELEDRVAARTRELEVRSQYLEASGQVAHAVASILDKEALIQQVVELIQEYFELYYVGLFEIDETNQWAILKAGTGEFGKRMLTRQHRLRIGLGSMIGWCIYNGQARIALEAGEDPVRLATEELPLTRSEAAIPIRARGRVIGALTVQSEQPNAFDEDIIIVLQTMADQVGVALDNAQLYTEAQEALESTMRAYGQTSREAWETLFQIQSGMSFTSDPSGISPAVDEQLLPEEQLAIIQEKTIIGEANQDQLQNLAIPIKIRGNVIGVLDVCKQGSNDSWSQEEVSLLETITEQLEVALESARLYQDSQHRAAREQLIAQVTSRMRETLDIETILKTAAHEIREALNLDEAEIRMGFDTTSERLQHEEQ